MRLHASLILSSVTNITNIKNIISNMVSIHPDKNLVNTRYKYHMLSLVKSAFSAEKWDGVAYYSDNNLYLKQKHQ